VHTVQQRLPQIEIVLPCDGGEVQGVVMMKEMSSHVVEGIRELVEGLVIEPREEKVDRGGPGQ